MIIAVDFDHTLVNGEQPLPGAKEAMRALRDAKHKIIIHSCNDDEWIRRVLNNNDIPYNYIWTEKGKPIAHAYIDDRAIRYTGDWTVTTQQISELAREK